ncbi:MAG TPA: bifunctional UDP-N-acetylglucosamine diphosphorylase/glucosamine-1-phosphate N-acetyltransferase GlmU [Nakamurella sp.]|nr:bifunctional UDP-N-acetylglucosamine diphosphorylase/glucosamine-1-phosphate N-acetyltransferase GlmU [Nakamurella sp.]
MNATEVSTPPPVTAVIVLAAGQGTRMRSGKPKVLHELAGRPLLWHALRTAAGVSPEHVIAVIGHGREQVEGYLAGVTDLPPVIPSVQSQQLGTGHAVACALQTMGRLEGTVIVTYGDVPLLRTETLLGLAAEHGRAGNAVTVLTAVVDDPTGYGRIVRDSDGGLTGIVEHRDADQSVRAVREINSGVYAFDGDLLAEALGRLSSANAQGERYLTDVVRIAREAGRPVGTVQAVDAAETEGINDRVQLAAMARRLNDRLVRAAQLAGVTVHDPASTWLHADVSIGADTEILPGTHLQAGTTIGIGCSIGPDTTLVDCQVGDGARVHRSHCHGARIGAGATVGPFTHLRPGSVICDDAEIGAFVEVKAATVGPGVKAHHLAYLGDATIGGGSNIGAGVITANYDGLHKSPTTIGDHAFIGSNVTLVAPVTVADGAYVAAGSTVTEAVDPGDLAVARGRQHNSPGWVLRRRPGSRSESAARAAGAHDHQQPDQQASDRHAETPAQEGQPTP